VVLSLFSMLIPTIASAGTEAPLPILRTSVRARLIASVVQPSSEQPASILSESRRLQRASHRARAHRAWLRRLHRARARALAGREIGTQGTSTVGTTSPAPATSSASASSSASADWYAIAACESGGDWAANTGNGYWGGVQFSPNTWFAYGGGPFDGIGPFPYSASAQIAVAERVLAGQGPSAWPSCFQ
jgi:transglycosylase-like protein